MAKFIQLDVEGPGPQWVNVDCIHQVMPHGQNDQRTAIKLANGSVLIFKGPVAQVAGLLPQ